MFTLPACIILWYNNMCPKRHNRRCGTVLLCIILLAVIINPISLFRYYWFGLLVKKLNNLKNSNEILPFTSGKQSSRTLALYCSLSGTLQCTNLNVCLHSYKYVLISCVYNSLLTLFGRARRRQLSIISVPKCLISPSLPLSSFYRLLYI